MADDIKFIFSRRLRQARTMRALSLRGLVEVLGGAVSHNALAKYENGEMMPGSNVLGQLADALGQAPDFFFRPFSLHLREIKFRKQTRLGVKDKEAIQEQALEFFERYHETEELLGESGRFAGKLQIKPVRTEDDAEKAADELRDKWDLGRDPLPNLVELIESKGIKVFEAETEDPAFDGFCADTEIGPVVVLASKLNRNLLRKRMTTVHELAHIVLPMADSLDEKAEEKIVARFAGSFLMPKETFIAAFGKLRSGITLVELIELKANYGASISAIMMRARQLGLISDAVFHRFWISAGQKWRSAKEEPGDDRYGGNETHSRFKQLVQRAVAEDQMTMTRGAGLLRQSLGAFRKELQAMFV